MELHGRVAIITGAGQGMGRCEARNLAKKGAIVVISDLNPEMGNGAAAEIESIGGQGLFVKADVTNVDQINEMVNTVEKKFGRIDILINNAGVVSVVDGLEETEAQWDRTLDTNLKGAFFCSQAVAKRMAKSGGGRIVNVASTGAYAHAPGMVSYSVSKAGVVCLTRALAIEWARYGIFVNCVAPGTIETEMVKNLKRENPDAFRDRARRIPLGRIGDPQDVANAVLFLVSPEASYVTGVTILVDGGIICASPAWVGAQSS